MGLHLMVNLFYLQDHSRVYQSLASFYQSIGKPLQSEGDWFISHELYEFDHPWTVHRLGGDRDLCRDAMRHVSADLNCIAFFIYVDDGDYWAYEMLNAGIPVDYFVQQTEFGDELFPGKDVRGDASILSQYLPHLSQSEIEPYLVQPPPFPAGRAPSSSWDEYERKRETLDVPPRKGDHYTRFSENAVYDFLTMLGVHCFNWSPGDEAPKFHRFWLKGRQFHSDRQHNP